jgi:uncharacterized protein YkwD
MFKKILSKQAIIITIIIFAFQFPVFAQEISNEIEVKNENLPIVLSEEDIETNIARQQISPASSTSAQLYFAINSVNNVVQENDFLQIILEETNKQRLANSLPVLTLNSQLNKAAELKAADMAQNNYFAHNSPAGLTSWHWFDEVGYNFRYAGENLAADFNSPREVVQAWMVSPSHRKNILDNKFTEIGLAIVKGNYNGHSSLLVVQMFGRLQIRVNSVFNAEVIVDSQEQSINLVHASIHYPSDKLILDAINFDNSDFSLFLKEIDIEKGIVKISAIQPFPGIKGIAKIANLQFRTLTSEDIYLNWNDDSAVLANDSFGTNVLGKMINF